MNIFIWHVITREQAIHLHVAKLFDVYKLYDDNSEGLADSVDDILNHQGEFGIEIDKYKIINEHNDR